MTLFLPSRRHFVGLVAASTSCHFAAVGRPGVAETVPARGLAVGDVIRRRYKTNGGSYLSLHDMREVLGFGTATKINWIEIKWPLPSGRVERLTDIPIDRYVTIVEGQGRIKG